MKARFSLPLILLVLALGCPTPGGTEIWAVGQSGQASGYWRDGTWPGLQGATPAAPVTARCIGASGSEFVIGGASGGVPGYWLDPMESFTPLTPPAGSTANEVDTIVLSGATVLAGGRDLDGAALPGYWSNGTWVGLGAGAHVSALAASVTDVYAGGTLGAAVGFWRNGAWTPLTPAPGSATSTVTALAVSGTDVYVGGACGTTPGYWRNGTWTPLVPPPVFTAACTVQAIAVAGSDVYAACASPGSAGRAAGYWLNQTWVGLPAVAGSTASTVTSLWVLGSDLYAGGFCTTASGTVGGYWVDGLWWAVPAVLPTDVDVQVQGIAARTWHRATAM